MKRSGFRQLTYEEKIAKLNARREKRIQKAKQQGNNKPKRVIRKRPQKTELQKAKDKLWQLCKKLIRKRDGNRCFTCGKGGLMGSGWHTGHFIASSVCGGYLRYDLRNLASQCYRCNINLAGNGAIFNQRMRERWGDEFVEKLFVDREKGIQLDVDYVKGLIATYKKLVDKSPKELEMWTFRFRQ